MRKKWKLIIATSLEDFGVSCWTYHPKYGYIYEGTQLSIKNGIKAFRGYLWVLNNCFPLGRCGFQAKKKLKVRILRIVLS